MYPALTRGWPLHAYGVDDPQEWWETEAWEDIHANAEFDPTDKRYFDLINAFYHRYGIPLVSRTRVVFNTGDGYVIKVPITEEGVQACIYEVQFSNQEDPYVPVAHTEFVQEHPVASDLVVVKMEEVTPVYSELSYGTFPDWVSQVDCEQVGINRAGKLVAYDV